MSITGKRFGIKSPIKNTNIQVPFSDNAEDCFQRVKAKSFTTKCIGSFMAFLCAVTALGFYLEGQLKVSAASLVIFVILAVVTAKRKVGSKNEVLMAKDWARYRKFLDQKLKGITLNGMIEPCFDFVNPRPGQSEKDAKIESKEIRLIRFVLGEIAQTITDKKAVFQYETNDKKHRKIDADRDCLAKLSTRLGMPIEWTEQFNKAAQRLAESKGLPKPELASI